MVGLEVENAILRQSLKDELLKSGYMVFEQGNRLLDLTVVQGERNFDGVLPDKILLLTDDEFHPLINSCIFCMSENEPSSRIAKRIKSLTEKDKTYGSKISEMLLDLGISPLMKGYKLLKCAIDIYIEHNDFKMKEVYELVGLHNGIQSKSVERNIRYALEKAFDKGRIKSYERLFKNSISPAKGKSTNGEFICLAAHLIKIGK